MKHQTIQRIINLIVLWFVLAFVLTTCKVLKERNRTAPAVKPTETYAL